MKDLLFSLFNIHTSSAENNEENGGKTMFENFKVFETTLAGRPLVVETGKMAGLANGSCLIRYGDTAILATATASAKPREGIDFLPLSVPRRGLCHKVWKNCTPA